MTDRLRFEIDGAIATITNDNPDKHNAFDDEMDAALFEILAELRARPDVRAVIWRGEGKSFSSGRDVGSIGTLKVRLSHHELMRRGHRGIQQLWELDAPVIVACKGWVMGGSFQRALLCDIRVAAEGTRFRLPELTYGVIPDTGGVAVLYEMCGHGRRQRPGAHGPRHAGRGGAGARHREPRRAARRARRDGARDGRADRGGAGGDREDGPRGDPPPRASRRSARRWPTR